MKILQTIFTLLLIFNYSFQTIALETDLEMGLLRNEEIEIETYFFITNAEYQKEIEKQNSKTRFLINQLRKKYIYITTATLYYYLLSLTFPNDENSKNIIWFPVLVLVGALYIVRKLLLNVIIHTENLDVITKRVIHFTDVNGLRCFFDKCSCCLHPDALSFCEPLIIHFTRHNKLEYVRLVLSKWECVPEEKYSGRLNALTIALKNNNLEITKLLLDKNRHKLFDLNLHFTSAIISKCNREIINLLHSKGGKFIASLFNIAIKQADYEYIKLLIDKGIDVNIKDNNGTPAIIAAVLNKKCEVIELLMSKNVDAGVGDAEGKTATDYLNELPEIQNAPQMRSLLKPFRKKIENEIYEAGLPRDHAFLISGYVI